MPDLFSSVVPKKHSKVSRQIWRRIRLAVWAYAYEIRNNPLVPDHQFDQECLKIRPKMSTSYPGRNNSKIDKWFRRNFDPSTGMWIHKHPDLAGIDRYYQLWSRLLEKGEASETYAYYALYARSRLED